MTSYNTIINGLLNDLAPLTFDLPVTHVYNPLEYARKPHDLYLRRYGKPPKEIVLVGMNPGPWGMAQTGVPFGEVDAVQNWLKITGPVGRPEREHPKRPIDGFSCHRSEVSGRRLWGWAKKTFQRPELFFKRFFVANYCPLMFMEQSGKKPASQRPSSGGPEASRTCLRCRPAADHPIYYPQNRGWDRQFCG